MGQEKSYRNKQAKDTAKEGTGHVSFPYPPKAEEHRPEKNQPAHGQLSRERQKKPRERREGKAEAAEK
jgi:hypothetical protein